MTLSDFILAFKALEKETKGRCFYCGIQTVKSGHKSSETIFQTRDHVIPLGVDGGNKRANRVVSCHGCNRVKEDLALHEFKLRSGILIFYAETILKTCIDDLDDIQTITSHILAARKRDRKIRAERIEKRSIRLNAIAEPRLQTD